MNKRLESVRVVANRVETRQNVINIAIRDLDVLRVATGTLDDDPALIARIYAQANLRAVT